jgi:hypothetical protein
MVATILMRSTKEGGRGSSGEQVRVRVLERCRFSISNTGSSGRVFPTLGCRMCLLFHTFYVTLYVPPKREPLALFECLDSDLGVM